MTSLIVSQEVIEAPLSSSELSERWRELLADPRYSEFAGKIDLDCWGRITVSPVNTEHADMAGKVAYLLRLQLGGRVLVEAGVRVANGVVAPDVAWCSDPFWAAHRHETPLERAPELCVEVASPSNAIHDLRSKARAYVDAGAVEAWILFPKSRRAEIYGAAGSLERTAFEADLASVFD